MDDPQFDDMRQIHPDRGGSELGVTDENYIAVAYHLSLLVEAGLVEGRPGSRGMPIISRLTWEGHEFLDVVRDDGVWRNTKEAGKRAGATGLEIMFGIAREVVKGKVAEVLGGAFGG